MNHRQKRVGNVSSEELDSAAILIEETACKEAQPL